MLVCTKNRNSLQTERANEKNNIEALSTLSKMLEGTSQVNPQKQEELQEPPQKKRKVEHTSDLHGV